MTNKNIVKIHSFIVIVILLVITLMIFLRRAFFIDDFPIAKIFRINGYSGDITTAEWAFFFSVIIGVMLILFLIHFTVQYNLKVVKYDVNMKRIKEETDIVSDAIMNLNPDFIRRAVIDLEQLNPEEEGQCDRKELLKLINEILKQREVISCDRRKLNLKASILIKPLDCVEVQKSEKKLFNLRKDFSEKYNVLQFRLIENLDFLEEYFCTYDHLVKCKKLLKAKEEEAKEQDKILELEKIIQIEGKILEGFIDRMEEIKEDWKTMYDNELKQLSDLALAYNHLREMEIDKCM